MRKINFEAVGGRRFFLAFFCNITATYLLKTGSLDPVNYKEVVIWTCGAYIAGATVEEFKDRFKNRSPNGINPDS